MRKFLNKKLKVYYCFRFLWLWYRNEIVGKFSRLNLIKNAGKRPVYIWCLFYHFKVKYQRVSLTEYQKASHVSDIPVEIIMEHLDLIACLMIHNFDKVLSTFEYPTSSK